jgi:hypothetical protein
MHQDIAQPRPAQARAAYISKDFDVSDLNADEWEAADPIKISQYWSGDPAPPNRHFTTRLLWSGSAFYVRFDAVQTEPLVVSGSPDLTKKSSRLWERDVCEIFIAPERVKPNEYYEFEIAPSGEWLDVAIEVLPEKRFTDWDYRSGMTSAARIEKNRVTMAMKIPWKAFGRKPKSGDKWRGNLFRCVGKDTDRGYLAWQPTFTKEPAFHVPGRFGEFVFVTR